MLPVPTVSDIHFKDLRMLSRLAEVTGVLSRRVADGYYTLDYAKRVGRYILHDNAERLYGFC